jgi:hypothetical protein
MCGCLRSSLKGLAGALKKIPEPLLQFRDFYLLHTDCCMLPVAIRH